MFFFQVATYLEFLIKSQKRPAMVLAWENLQEVFVMLVVISFLYLHFVVVVHLSMFFIHIFFSTLSFTLLWTITRFLHSFCTFSPAHCRVICGNFIFNHSVIFLLRALLFGVGIFYPQANFTVRSLLTFLAQPAFIKASLGAGSYSLKFAGFILILETQTRPICLFDSQ